MAREEIMEAYKKIEKKKTNLHQGFNFSFCFFSVMFRDKKKEHKTCSPILKIAKIYQIFESSNISAKNCDKEK